MKIQVNSPACWRLTIFAIGLVTCFFSTDGCASPKIKADLYKVIEDLKTEGLSKIEVISLHNTVTATIGITPDIFDAMVGDKTTPSMVMSECELPLSSAIDSTLAHILSHAAETAAESRPREIYWRIRLFGASNEPKYTIYIGKRYINATDVGVVINSDRANVDQALVKWFENNIDYERCSFRPSAEG
jgi:hypothetical protein